MNRLLFAIVSLAPMGAAAESGAHFSFNAGLGAVVAPSYFGSDDYEVGPTGSFQFGHLKLGKLEFGNPDPDAVSLGWHPRGSLRVIGERSSADHSELAGLDDIDLSVELGGGIGYRAENFAAFADARYGVIGHQSWVGVLGADAIIQPDDKLTLTIGPRILWGSQDYTATYFGVTAAESAASAFPVYAPGEGIVSAGLELGATYKLSQDWSLAGTLKWDRLSGDAANSPIVRDKDSYSFSLVLMRRFSLGY
ncbi:MAG: MipA/OmpV family protein [Roseivivax sp.]|nr:MipA/OmpV family protein [Roseivivax sp.]